MSWSLLCGMLFEIPTNARTRTSHEDDGESRDEEAARIAPPSRCSTERHVPQMWRRTGYRRVVAQQRRSQPRSHASDLTRMAVKLPPIKPGPRPDIARAFAVASAVSVFRSGAHKWPSNSELGAVMDVLFPTEAPFTPMKTRRMVELAEEMRVVRVRPATQRTHEIVLTLYSDEDYPT